MREFIKLLLPPILLKWIHFKPKYGWSGDYKTWEDAESRCTGYDADNILEKVKDALLKVKNGSAAYERDSVIFDEIEYAWPLLACLERAAIENDNRLNVLDFGGSLGSTYFQNRNFLSGLSNLSWNIVEQPHFVEYGQTYFQDEKLKFYPDIESCLQEQKPNVLVLSSVLQYLKNPYEWIELFKGVGCRYVIIDRTAFTERDRDHITVQKVSPTIYNASYVCRFFSEHQMLQAWLDQYDVLCQFDVLDVSNLENTYFRGFTFKKK